LVTGDPDFFYSYYLAPEAPRDFGWRNQEAGALIARARYEMGPARRRGLYRRLAELVNQELPILPLYHDVSLHAYRGSLAFFEMGHNFRPRPDLVRILCPRLLLIQRGRVLAQGRTRDVLAAYEDGPGRSGAS
jgi:peptide/nickel transport system substrate-binding protein